MTEYRNALSKVFGRFISWDELKSTERELQARVMLELDEAIMLKESPFDAKKLARAIQDSRSGVGGCAMREFQCKFCGKEELWSNTNTPGICIECATGMAKNIIKYNLDIMKDETDV